MLTANCRHMLKLSVSLCFRAVNTMSIAMHIVVDYCYKYTIAVYIGL